MSALERVRASRSLRQPKLESSFEPGTQSEIIFVVLHRQGWGASSRRKQPPKVVIERLLVSLFLQCTTMRFVLAEGEGAVLYMNDLEARFLLIRGSMSCFVFIKQILFSCCW